MSVTRLLAIGLGIHLLAATACSDASSSRSPTAATPIPMAERRVGDADGGAPPDCVAETCSSAPLMPRWEIVTANGDTLGFVCSTASNCTLIRTGRFEGLSFTASHVDGQTYETSFVVQDGAVDLVLSVRLQDGPSILAIATLTGRTEIVPDLTCASGQRVSANFAGTIAHLGRVSGYYSICVRPPAASTSANTD